MCRLFGFKGSKETKLVPYLLTASNSLYKQALKDARDVSNTEGWGIGFYENGCPYVHKRAQSARTDTEYTLLTNEIHTKTMIAHVRQATVGDINDFNAHPFTYAGWVFAHNGTIENFDHLKHHILNFIAPHLRSKITGTSDSEHCFYLFLSELTKIHDPYDTNITVHQAAMALNNVIQLIHKLSEGLILKEPHAINFLMTNGFIMIASRVNNTLYYTNTKRYFHDEIILQPDDNVHDVHLEIDIDEVPNGTFHKNVIIASEPITQTDTWHEVSNSSMIMVDNNLKVVLQEISACA